MTPGHDILEAFSRLSAAAVFERQSCAQYAHTAAGASAHLIILWHRLQKVRGIEYDAVDAPPATVDMRKAFNPAASRCKWHQIDHTAAAALHQVLVQMCTA